MYHSSREDRPVRRLRAALWSLAYLGLCGVPLFAEEGEEPQFFDTIEVRRVNVEVYVTDRDGRPVTGLSAADFEVFEDGRRVEVANFFAVEEGRPRAAEEDVPEDGQASTAGGPALHPALVEPLPDDQRLLLVVFIDNSNIRPQHRAHVLTSLRGFLLGEVAPGARVMVVSYDRGLNVRQPFTSHWPQAVDALYQVQRLAAEGTHLDQQFRTVMDTILYDAESSFEALAAVRVYAEARRHETEVMLRELGDLVTSMAGLEGRKAILYVSDGLPLVPGDELFWAVNEQFSDVGAVTESMTYDLSRRFRELVARANAGRITFYTVDASGGRPFGRMGADQTQPVSVMVDSARTSNLQSSLRMLADDSGGQAVFNTTNFDGALERMAQDFRTYYSLAYAPPSAWDGRYRTIEVRVANRRWNVRHRKGYRARAPGLEMADRTLAAVVYDHGSNPMRAEVELGGLLPREGRTFVLPVVVRVPISEVVLIPRGEELEGRLTLHFALLDARGDRSPLHEVEFPIRIRAEDAERAMDLTYAYRGALVVGPGQQRMGVGIRDQIGGTTSFLVTPVVVPDS